MRRLAHTLALVSLVAGCSRNTELIDDGSIPGLVSIEVTPGANGVVIDDLATIATVELTALGRFDDGATRDITAEVEWGVDNAFPGGFVAPGRWESSNRAGGLITAGARAGAVRGEARIAVHFEPTLNDPSFPVAPGADAPFSSAPVLIADPSSPTVLYPSDETMFPINLHRTLFQFDTGPVSDVFLVRFVSDYLDLKLLTKNDRWQAEGATWDYLARTAAGFSVEMTVSGVESANPVTVYQSAPVELAFSRATVDGAIYYWSTSSEGIMKTTLADASPSRFYTRPPEMTCVGCHTVSRDGTRMSVGYDGEVLQEVSVPAGDVIIDVDRGYEMGWSTFSPDSSMLLLASKGALTLVDADTGDPIAGGAVDLGNVEVTHPDWSPLGDSVVVAMCANAGNNKDVEGCSIASVPVSGTSFGTPQVLVAAGGGGDNNYFPRYSPDGAWIAYVNADGKSKDQSKAALRVVRSSGGTPIELAIASSRVGPSDGVSDTGSSMPTWAPTSHGSIMWLAFSSTRDYGKVLVGDKADQLWIAALDTSRAVLDQDPSFAAFWLPAQDIDQRNHRAFWAIDSSIDCSTAIEVCDGLDNDCDGLVDDGCVDCASEEICFDGADNDCNGDIDDGCIR